MDEFQAIVDMARSQSLAERIVGCVAEEGVQPREQPGLLVSVHMSRLCAAPGWAAKWLSAVAANVPDPGADPAVITADDIRARVQAYDFGLPA